GRYDQRATTTGTVCRVDRDVRSPPNCPAGVLVNVMQMGDISFEYQAVSVHQVVSVRPLEQYVQIKTFVTEIIAKSAHVFRQTVSDDGFVARIDHTVTVQVFVLDVSGLNSRSRIAIVRHLKF